ncbi:restriction endonuclease subunit S [Streptococcus parasanguinis]|uniref:restriction endonuclease subunit S n=1 Tax=Streptococcus parasanguinis TaxID=1318 RepID=UPI0018997DCD|nr:restriction endonuclease subunit S [Streptococcus parasanguinis]
MKPKISFSEEQKDWIKRPLLSNIEKILDYRGRTPKKLGLSWSDAGFLALSALNVKNGYIDFNSDANYGDQELYDRWMGDNHLHKGQVVFTTEAPMGNVAQIPNDDLYILSQRTIAFEVKHDLIIEDFLATLLRSPKIFNELTSLSSGGTAKGVSQKSLSNLKVCVPASLEEQSAIGSLFRTLDDLLASYKDNLANYQSLKATMLSKMFPKAGQTIPEIRLGGFEGEWEKLKLRDVVHTNPKSELPENFKYIDLESVVGTRINKIREERKESAPSRAQRLAKKGDVFYQTVRPYQKNNYLFKLDEIDYVFSTGYAQLRPIFKRCDSDFLLILLQNNRFLSKVLDRCTGTSYPAINVNDLIEILIAIPSYEEQQAIGTYFSNLDNIINSNQEKISQLETLKKKLLQDMFI